MKLIIDIPDEEYKQLHFSRKLEENLRIYILNGKPYSERPKGEWLPFKYNYDLIEPSKYGSYVQILKDKNETHWEEYWGPEFVCSNCHAKNHKAYYCPKCGAQMAIGGEI